METQIKPILIIGIGNILMKDEGAGIHVVERMRSMPLPPYIEVLDGGSETVSLAYILEKRKKVVAVFALKGGGVPGSIYRFTGKDIDEKRKGYHRSIEEQKFTDHLKMTRTLGTEPDEVVIFGIEPEDTGEKSLRLEIGLSPSIEAKMPEIIEMVMRELK